jgi:hypothetical protein
MTTHGITSPASPGMGCSIKSRAGLNFLHNPLKTQNGYFEFVQDSGNFFWTARDIFI